MRPIDADAMRENWLQNGLNEHIYDTNAVLNSIDNQPTVDVEPVIHAKWIEDGYYGKPSVCSHCGEEAFYTSTFHELFDYDWDENLISLGSEEDREYVLTKWCPNCGAKMDDDITH